MHFGFDAKRLFNNFTGLGNYSRTLVRLLSTHFPDHQYHLYTPHITDHPDVRYFQDDPKISIHQPSSGLAAWWRTFRISKLLKPQGISLYHGLSHELPVGIHRTGIPAVVTIHDLVYKVYPQFFPRIDRFSYDWKFRYACREADVIVAISENTKQDIQKYFRIPSEKIRVIYQTCHERFLEKWDTESRKLILKKYQLPENYLLYVGAVNERKNLLNIVRAMEILPAGIHIPLVVIGDGGTYLQKVRRYLAGKPVEKLVIFPGPVDFRDLPAIYQQSQMLVYPSVYEGFGIPIIEALVSGTPVITSPMSSLPEAGGLGSYYAYPQSPESIAVGIEKILTNEGFRQKMIEDGYLHAEKFGQTELTRQMMDLYSSLVGST